MNFPVSVNTKQASDHKYESGLWFNLELILNSSVGKTGTKGSSGDRSEAIGSGIPVFVPLIFDLPNASEIEGLTELCLPINKGQEGSQAVFNTVQKISYCFA